ncbi:putative KHDC1-like protein [Mirounga leonina]|uniref:putative KHDC1-like protein n=1 Tax=Mirounga leonina TaxID=9715 RepID=UPI00156C5743|nr:putative KHDC1-like protein [Mirounga leonina]
MDSDDCVDLNHADECPQGWPMSFGQKGRLKSKKTKTKTKNRPRNLQLEVGRSTSKKLNFDYACVVIGCLEVRLWEGSSSLTEKPWCTVSENFYLPLVFYMEVDQEERIFGHLDTDLHCFEVHSHTLIQLESWFTATGHTRVPVVGPPKARRWLFGLI